MNLSCEIEEPCAAEIFVEAAASPSRCVVGCNAGREYVEKVVCDNEKHRKKKKF
jgi:hypothetical protein